MYFSIVFFARSYSQYSLQSIITPENCFGGQICGIQPTGNHNLLNYNDACGDIEIYVVVAFFVKCRLSILLQDKLSTRSKVVFSFS